MQRFVSRGGSGDDREEEVGGGWWRCGRRRRWSRWRVSGARRTTRAAKTLPSRRRAGRGAALGAVLCVPFSQQNSWNKRETNNPENHPHCQTVHPPAFSLCQKCTCRFRKFTFDRAPPRQNRGGGHSRSRRRSRLPPHWGTTALTRVERTRVSAASREGRVLSGDIC